MNSKKYGKPIYPDNKGNFILKIFGTTFRGYKTFAEAEIDYIKLKSKMISLDDFKKEKAASGGRKYNYSVTFEQVAKEYLENLYLITTKEDNPDIKYSTYQRSKSLIESHIIPHFKGKTLIGITNKDVEDFYITIRGKEKSLKKRKNESGDTSYHSLSISVQRNIIIQFKLIYRKGIKRYGIPSTIDLDDLKLPSMKIEKNNAKLKIKERISNYNQKKRIVLENLAKVEHGIYNPVFGLSLLSECFATRIDELVALKISDIDFTNNKIVFSRSVSWHPNKAVTDDSYVVTATKEYLVKELKLYGIVKTYLENYVKELRKNPSFSEEWFLFRRGSYAKTAKQEDKAFSLKTLDNHKKQAIDNALKSGVIDKTYWLQNHDNRHAIETYLNSNGIDEYHRKVFLGHSIDDRESITNVYTHEDERVMEKIYKLMNDYLKQMVLNIDEMKEVINEDEYV